MQKIRKMGKIKTTLSDRAAPKRDRKTRVLEVLMAFRIIVNSVKRHFKWVETQCGINGAQLWALWEIQETPGLRVTQLAAAMAMHQSSASNLVDKLVKAKLIERERMPGDQRVVTLGLTALGRKLLKRAPKPARGMLPEALHHLSAHELTLLDKLLQQVLQEMKLSDRESMKEPLGNLLTNG